MIDLDYLKKFFGDNPKEIHDFLDLFTNSSQEIVQKMEEAIQNKDLPTVKFCAHKLLGSAGNSGFVKLSKLCDQMEESIAKEDWGAITQCFVVIKDYIKKLEVEVSKLYQK